MEIPEREWLQAGFFWISLGLLMALPRIGDTFIGHAARFVFCLAVVIHICEALYNLRLARRANLDSFRWGLRSLVLGYLALRRLRKLTSSSNLPV